MDSKNCYILSCDVCEFSESIPASDHASAWTRAMETGWTVRKNDPDIIHVCTGCRSPAQLALVSPRFPTT